MTTRTILGMTFELKKISHSERLSEETNAYAADLYVDGKLFAHVSNQGFGGCDMQHSPKGMCDDRIWELDKRLKAEGPKETAELSPGHSFTMDCDIEKICGDLLTDHLIAKDLKRALGKVLFFDGGKIYTTGFKGVRKHSPEQVARLAADVKAKRPAAVVLNALPFDEALAIYRKAA